MFFSINPMEAIRYSCPIRLVPTYLLPAKERRLLGKFQPASFKTERLVCVETDGQTDMARSTRLVMLIKNIYTLRGQKRLLHCVANFWPEAYSAVKERFSTQYIPEQSQQLSRSNQVRPFILFKALRREKYSSKFFLNWEHFFLKTV